jgi:hypothetical protein
VCVSTAGDTTQVSLWPRMLSHRMEASGKTNRCPNTRTAKEFAISENCRGVWEEASQCTDLGLYTVHMRRYLGDMHSVQRRAANSSSGLSPSARTDNSAVSAQGRRRSRAQGVAGNPTQQPWTGALELWDDDVGFEPKLTPEQLARSASRARP